MRRPIVPIIAAITVVFAVVLGSYLRTSRLDLRPMHTDEAIQAQRLGTLMEGGGFDYNPEDGHGPGLLYLTAPVAWLKGASSYTALDETTVRLGPALTGIVLVAAAALFWRSLGPTGVAAAALLTALSPMHVYYSRYFIMELPMVLFLALFLVSLWAYYRKPSLGWMIAAGVCGAWMHATKETFAISIAALLLAICVVFVVGRFRNKAPEGVPLRLLIGHAAIGFAISIVMSAALYSVFFKEFGSVGESYSTYFHYLERSEGSGHEKPFAYYLELLVWKPMEIFSWSEALILALAAVGGLSAFWRRDLPSKATTFLQVLALYALFTLLIYSALAYKTPWSILAFLHAAILLAGAGFAYLVGAVPSPAGKAIVFIGLGIGCWHLYRQDVVANFQFPANEDRNPYVYSHTSPRLVSKLVSQVDELRGVKPELTVQVFHPETGWPLPWYFRDIERAGFYPTAVAPVVADVVIADENYAEDLEPLLENRYIGPELCNLRDNVMLHMYVERELFFEMVERRPITMP